MVKVCSRPGGSSGKVREVVMLFGTIVNTLTVLLGSGAGLLFKRGIPERMNRTLMQGLGLCTLFLGVQGAMKGENTLVMILSMILGVVIGEAADIDRRVNEFFHGIEAKLARPGAQGPSIAEGFINACLLFCIGSMTVVGALNAGLQNDQSMLLTKSMLDLCSSMVFASTMGIGVLFSAVFVLVYQGALTLLASLLAPVLTATVIAEMTCAGSLLIIGTGLNLLGLTKLKLMNFLPAMFMPILLCQCSFLYIL